MSRLAPVGAALFAAFAAWLSQGTMGFAAPDGPRIAVLPVSGSAIMAAVLAAAGVLALRRAGASLLPLALLGLLLLPWLPFTVPASFLLWVSPVAMIVWIAVLLLMIGSLPMRLVGVHLPNPRVLAAALACALFAVSAWRAAPMLPGGDEPHYLVITQSLLRDHSLAIDKVHRRGDYRVYWAAELPAHVQQFGRDGRMYSVHAPGLPALVLPAFAIGGYRGVVVFLVLLASVGSALAWHVAWLATRRNDAAWFGWAAVTLPVTAIFQSFTIYPDGPGGILVLTGVWALLRADEEARSGATRSTPWLFHGVALAVLPWLHSRFAVLAGGLGGLVLLRLATTKNPAAKAVLFLAVPAVSAMLWVGYFVAIYGRPDPSAAYAPGELGSLLFVPGGLGGLLFDQRFGLLTYAPVLALAFAGLGVMVIRPPWRRLALELLFVVVPYLLTVTHFAMWWGGRSAPARFFAPLLPLFVVPAAVTWTMIRGRASRLVACTALVLTGIASAIVVWIDRGRLAFNTREAPALWLEWIGRLADLTTAAPMWTRDADLPLFRAAAVWIAVLVAAWVLLRITDRRNRLRIGVQFSTAAVAVLAVAVMAASSLVWALGRASTRTTVPSQLRLVDAIVSHPRVVAVQLDPWSRLSAADVPGELRIELISHPAREAPSTLVAFPPLTAGDYRLTVTPDLPRGWLMVGIVKDARDPFALRTLQMPVGAIDLRFPLSVRGLVVRGDEEARRIIRQVIIEPLRVRRPAERLTSEAARRAVRYGEYTVYFLDDRSFPEPDAFWVAGRRASTVVVQPDVSRSSTVLRVRNAPVDNRVTLSIGTWRRDLQMGPGEEQQVEVPLDAARGGAVLRVESASGFRPSEQDPSSRDQRFLGVWIRIDR